MLLSDADLLVLKKLHSKGLVSYKVFFYNDINTKVIALIRSGMIKTGAVTKLAGDLRVSKQTIWNALRIMKD